MYYNKYLKYKNKYLQLKGGAAEPHKGIQDFINSYNINEGIKEIVIEYIKHKSIKHISDEIIPLTFENDDIKNFFNAISEHIQNSDEKDKNKLINTIGDYLSEVIDHYYSVIQKKLLDTNYCNYNNKNIIIHLSYGDPITNIDLNNVEYTHHKIDTITDLEFIKTKILNSCNKYNIGIYISTINIPSNDSKKSNCKIIIDKFNDLLKSLADDKYIYNNVTIIHSNGFADININTYENPINKNNEFYKIINIHDTSIIAGGVTYYPDKLEIRNEEGYKIYYKISKDKIIINYDILNKETWWYKLMYGTPYCLRNRFTQSTGTCWMNAVINSLILVPKIKYMLIKAWYDNTDLKFMDKTILFKDFNDSPNNLKSLLYSVIYNLFISKKKATPEDKNFIVSLAARIKGLYYNKGEFHYKTCINMKTDECNTDTGPETEDGSKGLLYGDAGDPGLGVKTFIETYFVNDNFLLLEKGIFTGTNRIKQINSDALIKKIIEKNYPVMVVICYPIHEAPDKLVVNDYTYILECCTVLLPRHAICGINCNGEKYIYDSNNFLTQDDWHQGSIVNYRTTVDPKVDKSVAGGFTNEDSEFESLGSVIYIREDYPESEGILPPYENIVY